MSARRSSAAMRSLLGAASRGGGRNRDGAPGRVGAWAPGRAPGRVGAWATGRPGRWGLRGGPGTVAQDRSTGASDPVLVLYEDNHLIAVYKPANVLTQGDATGDPSLMDAVKAWLKARYHKPGNVFL